MQNLIKLVSRLALSDLEKLAGSTIIRAVKTAYDTNNERELARLIVDRYGNNILNQKTLRLGLIDGLSYGETLKFCKEKRIKIEDIHSKIEPRRKLLNRFSSALTSQKAREFVNLFGLHESLIPIKEVDNRQVKIKVESTFGEELKSKGVLHPYQVNIKDALAKSVVQDQIKRTMLEMPTGAGKTMTALELVIDFIRSHQFSGKIVWIVNSNELADQAFESFISLWKLRGDRPTSAYRFFDAFKPNFSSCEDGIVFTSFTTCHAASESNHPEVVQNFQQLCDSTQLVLVDEAHSSVALTHSNTISRLLKKNPTLIGISATPVRNSEEGTKELKAIYGTNIVKMKDSAGNDMQDALKFLQDEEYLAQINYQPLDSGEELKDYDEKQACVLLAQISKRNKIILNQIETAIDNNESTIVFACSVDHVIALVALCRAEELGVDFIIGEVSTSKRLEIMERFKNKDLKVIINHDMLSTGIDLPAVNKLIITRPIGSSILYSQIIGRALRGPKNGGNETNTIINITDNMLNYRQPYLLYDTLTF